MSISRVKRVLKSEVVLNPFKKLGSEMSDKTGNKLISQLIRKLPLIGIIYDLSSGQFERVRFVGLWVCGSIFIRKESIGLLQGINPFVICHL